MAEGEALQDYASLFLYLLKIDKNFLRGTVEGAGGGRKMGGYVILWAWKESGLQAD